MRKRRWLQFVAHEVVFRPQAERDLDSLYAYICDQRGESMVALGYIRRIRVFCMGLGDIPERGTRRDDIRKGLRIAGFEKRVAIAFTFDGRIVRIGRIFYGGRDYAALMGTLDGQ